MCAKYARECGKCTVASGKLKLTPDKGQPWTSNFAASGATNWRIGGLDCQRITASYPANAKLNKKFTSGKAYAGIASAITFVFSADGSYTVERVGSARSSGAATVWAGIR